MGVVATAGAVCERVDPTLPSIGSQGSLAQPEAELLRSRYSHVAATSSTGSQ